MANTKWQKIKNLKQLNKWFFCRQGLEERGAKT
jgi:hypothetical protein